MTILQSARIAGRALRVNKLRSGLTNLIIAMSGLTSSGWIRLGAGTQATITEDDALAVERDVSLVQVASPTSRGSAQIVY